MKSSNELDDLGPLISEVFQNPADLFHAAHYLSVCVNGNLQTAIKYINDKRWNEIVDLPHKLVAFNFSYTEVPETEMTECTQALQALCSKATSANLIFRFVACPPQLQECLAQALNEGDIFFESLTQFLKKYPHTSLDFESEMKLLIDAVIEVFHKQFQIEAKPLEMKLIKEDSNASVAHGDVIALMPLMAAGASGNLILRFQSETLIRIAKHSMDKDLQTGDPLLPEIAAELVNMILGCAKAELNRRGYGIEQALPQTYVAKSQTQFGRFLARPSWSVDFDTRLGRISLEVSIRAL